MRRLVDRAVLGSNPTHEASFSEVSLRTIAPVRRVWRDRRRDARAESHNGSC